MPEDNAPNNGSAARAKAKELIETICKEHGNIEDEVWDKLGEYDPSIRERLQFAFNRKDEMLAHSVMTLAKNLYTSNARFVFELLQNAEDNRYARAREQGHVPYISFQVYNDRIIIECNEDGFKKENVRAICDVGKSSKIGAQGYIGAKGIGFKSVFMAAWRVHIQSGDFSFYFKHRNGDPGLGMISPFWQDHVDDLSPHVTRMTLHLHDTGDPAVLSSQREAIRQQFNDLQQSVLLFMRNLRKISISFLDHDGKIQKSTVFSASEIDDKRVKLNKSFNDGAKVSRTHQIYHVTKSSVDNLPKHDDRTYSEQEDRSRAYAKAQVILAFPISNASVPIVKPRDVFAFLPMRHMGFSFLIQSDFVTQANRQDIVATSPRNQGIIKHISDVFVQSVLEFCEHPDLRYTWVRFLPNKSQYPYDKLWSTLVNLIETKLSNVPVLLPGSETSLRRIDELRELESRYCDCRGDPLFRDVTPEKWLSRLYHKNDVKTLRSWGMPRITAQEILAMVQKDLDSPNSQMKIEEGDDEWDDDWQTRAATMLLDIARSSAGNLSTLRTFKLIPCEGDPTCWISVSSVIDSTICFAETEDGIPIPHDLDLRIVTPTALKNPARVQLYKSLGVTFANTNELRNSIYARHQFYLEEGVDVELSDVVDQLEFLYLTDHADPESEEEESQLTLADESGYFWGSSSGETLYLSDQSPYGPSELLRATDAGEEPGAGAPGMDVRFLHGLFTQDPPDKPSLDSETWSDWLVTRAGVEDSLGMVNASSCDLSSECYYVARHRPEKFVGLLRFNWLTDDEVFMEETLQKKLREVEVLCHGNQMRPLSETYLPLRDLREECARFLTSSHAFPFVKIEDKISRETYQASNWDFLIDYAGVRAEDDVAFYLAILGQLCESAPEGSTASRVVDLYSMIYTKFVQYGITRGIQGQRIKEFFHKNEAIYIPAYGDTLASWTSLERCLWQGLSYMTTHHTLRPKYDELCAQMSAEKHNVERLFCDLLSVRDCEWVDLIEELQNIKGEEDIELEKITQMYEHLMTFAEDLEDCELEALRNEFKSKGLIYRPLGPGADQKWHCVRGCLWSSSAKIRGKVTLSDYYEDLESFFVDILEVQTLTFDIVYKELIHLGSSSDASAADTRDQIMSLNSFLMDMDPRRYPKATKLIAADILPIREPDQTVSLASAKTDFVIVDRTHLEEIFAARVKTLDFTFDEVHRLGPFIKLLRQDNKRLSEMVREITTVDESDKQPLQCRQRQIGPKAHALYRVAFHFDSPRLESGGHDLYKMLLSAKVYTTEGISSELHLSQDGKDHCHIKERSDLHIREHGSILEIFVSRKQKKQDFCWSSKLNKYLFQWLMTDPITQISETLDSRGLLTVHKILNSRQSVLAQILEEDGIATGDIEEIDQSLESDDDSDEEDSEENETLSVSTTSSIQRTSHDRSEHNSDHNRTGFSSPVLDGEAASPQSSSDRDAEHRSPTSPVAWGSPQASQNGETEQLRYENFLRGVVTAARRSQFPARDSFDMSGISSALSVFYSAADGYDGFVESHRFHSTSQFERDKKIGAAGELYVFELLKTLDLPNFSIHQWQSTIRHYAAAHPDYADIRQWSGRETSDLTYHDVQGDFTRLLIDSGYLDEELWRHRRPMYFLEVKTTTGPCNTPFFVSKGQYERIRNHRDTTDTVYIIIRVFQVGSDDVRARVYLNPARLADDGQLLFTAEKWSVVSS